MMMATIELGSYIDMLSFFYAKYHKTYSKRKYTLTPFNLQYFIAFYIIRF